MGESIGEWEAGGCQSIYVYVYVNVFVLGFEMFLRGDGGACCINRISLSRIGISAIYQLLPVRIPIAY